MTSPRQQQVLHTATLLFAERGFHGVSMHDIGAACGISGPALYKHFSGKGEILDRALTGISEELLATGRERADTAGEDPSAALDGLVRWHVEFAVDKPAYIVVQDREWSTLAEDARRSVRTLQLAYVDLWVETLRVLRPALDQPAARAAVQATFGLINSTPHSARIGKDALGTLLHTMALRALLA